MGKRFCYIKVKKSSFLRKKHKCVFLILCILSILICFIVKTNALIEPKLLAISKQKTNDALKLLTHEVLQSIAYDSEELIIYHEDSMGDIVSIEYDTKVLNTILEESLSTIKDSLEAAAAGEMDPLLKEVFFEDGIVYEVPIGYLTGIAFLQNVGYRIQIDLPLFHYVNGSLDIESEAYGINSSLISVYLNLIIKAEVITSIYVQEICFEEKIPLIIQVVQGDIPAYHINTKKD